MTTKTEQIRMLNDQLRKNFSEGTAVLTCGVAALGAEAVARIVKTVAIFDDFCHANDPHQEHDFGAFEADSHVIFSRLTITTRASRTIRRMQQTPNNVLRHARTVMRYDQRRHKH